MTEYPRVILLALIFGAVVGFLLGLLTAVFILPINLGEGWATSIGSGVGSIVTILGAIWLVRYKRYDEENVRKERLAKEIHNALALLEHTENWLENASTIPADADDAEDFKQKVIIWTALTSGGLSQLLIHADLIDELKQVDAPANIQIAIRGFIDWCRKTGQKGQNKLLAINSEGFEIMREDAASHGQFLREAKMDVFSCQGYRKCLGEWASSLVS